MNLIFLVWNRKRDTENSDTYCQSVELVPLEIVILVPIAVPAAAQDFAVCCHEQLVGQIHQALTLRKDLVVDLEHCFLPNFRQKKLHKHEF